MEPSIALVSGATSGLGYAGARLLAIKGYRQVIVPGRSLARVQETAAPARGWDQETGFHAAELDTPASVQSALARWSSEVELLHSPTN